MTALLSFERTFLPNAVFQQDILFDLCKCNCRLRKQKLAEPYHRTKCQQLANCLSYRWKLNGRLHRLHCPYFKQRVEDENIFQSQKSLCLLTCCSTRVTECYGWSCQLWISLLMYILHGKLQHRPVSSLKVMVYQVFIA